MSGENSGKNTFFRFLISKAFVKNILIAVVIAGLSVFLALKFLDIYTEHGHELKVPDFAGRTLLQIDSDDFNRNFDFFVIDSVYDDNLPGGSIVGQDPLPGSMVKEGRNIYLTTVSVLPEMVIMPDLKDLTLRQAVNVLESGKLKVGRLMYFPSFDKNAVLEQMCNGDTAFPGDTLLKGSVIDLLVGTGDKRYKVPVPFLIGKSRDEAIYEINVASFNLGNEIFMDSIADEHAKVYMQEPRWDTEYPFFPGDSIHLWYKSDERFDFETYVLVLTADSLTLDSLNIHVDSLDKF
ncbi:MAG: PASTA domain-containing protein [Chlorobi bacterium]|nr:PASTA domain-containing protein [Chlorobiota bacterium]